MHESGFTPVTVYLTNGTDIPGGRLQVRIVETGLRMTSKKGVILLPSHSSRIISHIPGIILYIPRRVEKLSTRRAKEHKLSRLAFAILLFTEYAVLLADEYLAPGNDFRRTPRSQ